MRTAAIAAALLLQAPAAIAAPYTPPQWSYLGRFDNADASVDMARLKREGRLVRAVVSLNELDASGNPFSSADSYWLDCQENRVARDADRNDVLVRYLDPQPIEGQFSWRLIARDSLSEKLAMTVCPTLNRIGKAAIVQPPPTPPSRAADSYPAAAMIRHIDRSQAEIRRIGNPVY